MKIDVEHMKIQDYLNHKFDCDCGREHSSTLQTVEIKNGALEEVPKLMKSKGYNNAYLIADSITYSIAGEKLSMLLKNAGLCVIDHVFRSETFVPDVTALGHAMVDYEKKCDVIIAVGTGSINDLSRFASYKWGKPFITVATAPPMDGFASNVAALIVDDLKTTYTTQAPSVIIGDTQIMKNAPLPMITAGLADTLGKYTCLCDWKLSHFINGEYYCPAIVAMVRKCVGKAYSNAEKILNNDSGAVGSIMEALVLTGIAMSFVNNSRPAAGSEHHLSHYWETILMQQGLPPVLHGAKVGIGTVMILKISELLRQHSVDFNAAREDAKEYNQQSWEKDIKRAYGAAADGIIKLEHESMKNDIEARLKRIDFMENNWDEICCILEEDSISSEELKKLLIMLGAPYLPANKGITNEMLWDAVVYAKEIRNRYTILQMVWDLGLSKHMADKMVQYVDDEQSLKR